MEPLKGGILCNLPPEAAALLKEAAPERSLASWSFRYLMSLPNIQTVLSGMSTLEHLRDNLKIFNTADPLSDEEQKVLEKALGILIKNLGEPCTACRYCCPACPVSLDIPFLIKGYNETKISGDAWRLDGLAAMPHGAADCIQCWNCLKRCPQHINIPKVMRGIVELSA